MSPFADKPELWLTSHVKRVNLFEPASKIQAVVKGYLVRRRLRTEGDPVDEAINRLLHPRDQSVVGILTETGLGDLVPLLPSARVCLEDNDLAIRRHRVLWDAFLSLRLTGQANRVQDLSWADYHERTLALAAHHPPPPSSQPFSPRPATPPPTLWKRLVKSVWG